jgi:YD repeat-containing protein
LLLSETWSGSVQGAVTWTYDNDFRITTESVRNAFSVTFGYDNDGLLMSAGDTTFARFPATGLLQSSTVGTVATSFGYNGFGELTGHATSVGGTPVYSAALGRDAGGRIQQQAEVLGGVATTDVYGYDAAGRLETVTRNGTLLVTYGYDANGNRNAVTTAGGTIAATFDAQDRILTCGTRTYTHTPHGDVAGWTDSATSTTTALTYDVQENLRTVQRSGTTITCTVDGRNRRIGKAVNGTPVQGFLWQGQLRPVAELDGAGNLVSRFVYGTRINVPEYLVKNGTTYRIERTVGRTWGGPSPGLECESRISSAHRFDVPGASVYR